MYHACVPPAQSALTRAGGLWDRAVGAGLTGARLAPDMFDLEGQLRTVAGFSLRAVFPVIGRAVPALSGSVPDRIAAARAALAGLTPDDFTGTGDRVIRHRAGYADIAQAPSDYVTLFALPNLWFHLSMAYAILRAGGVGLSKADFDGLHSYPPGFRFPP